MSRKLVVGNWKMNLSVSEGIALAKEVEAGWIDDCREYSEAKESTFVQKTLWGHRWRRAHIIVHWPLI